MPWESLSEPENQSKRWSKEFGWSVRVRCRMEYMVRTENAAEVVFVWTRWTNAERDSDEIGMFVEGS